MCGGCGTESRCAEECCVWLTLEQAVTACNHGDAFGHSCVILKAHAWTKAWYDAIVGRLWQRARSGSSGQQLTCLGGGVVAGAA